MICQWSLVLMTSFFEIKDVEILKTFTDNRQHTIFLDYNGLVRQI